jgi:hypothetical protein
MFHRNVGSSRNRLNVCLIIMQEILLILMHPGGKRGSAFVRKSVDILFQNLIKEMSVSYRLECDVVLSGRRCTRSGQRDNITPQRGKPQVSNETRFMGTEEGQ